MSDGLSWRWLGFDALSPHTLYALLQLRTEVFVVEQNCVFQDMDGADTQAMHVLGDGRGGAQGELRPLLAYARCFGPGMKFSEASIGRVITHPSVRGTGTGHTLMRQALACCQQHWGHTPIRIGAQAHLQNFYAQHGFAPTSGIYLEDGIDHIEMLRPIRTLENA